MRPWCAIPPFLLRTAALPLHPCRKRHLVTSRQCLLTQLGLTCCYMVIRTLASVFKRQIGLWFSCNALFRFWRQDYSALIKELWFDIFLFSRRICLLVIFLSYNFQKTAPRKLSGLGVFFMGGFSIYLIIQRVCVWDYSIFVFILLPALVNSICCI